MAQRMTIETAVQHITNLTPTYRSQNLIGDYAAVLSPWSSVPLELQEAQRRRTAAYLATGDRHAPDDAPQYFVTSYGVLIAYVTLDGTPFYPLVSPGKTSTRLATIRRHQDMVRAAWPAKPPRNRY